MKNLIIKKVISGRGALAGVSVSVFFLLFTIQGSLFTANAQTNEFTYQGRLLDNTLPPTANYDFQFSLWDALANGNQQGTTQTVTGVAVANGIFTVRINFGAQFTGANRFLQIAVRPAGGPSYTTLAPRQAITRSPYSIKSDSALSADGANSLSAACISCGFDSHINTISGSKVTGQVFSAQQADFATFAQNVSGVVAIANGGTGSSTQNFVDLSTNQTVNGNKTFTGTISGNGSGITNINGANIASQTVTSSQLSSEAVPNSTAYKLLGSLRWDLLKPQANFAVGSEPAAVAFDGANIWVSNQISNNVTKLRASDGASLGTFTVGSRPSGVAFDGANIWVANQSNNNVTKLRASDGATLGTFTVGTNPFGVAFDGANIWVANQGGNVTKLRASDGATLGTFAVGASPFGIAFDGANIWVASFSSSNVTKLRASDGATLGTFTVGTNPLAIAFDGANIWVANLSSNNVTKLRASDGANLGTFGAGSGPRGVAFDGANIWVANLGSNNVTKLRASDGANLGTFVVGIDPIGVAFDGANIWVANLSSNNVTKLLSAFPQ